MNRRQAFQRLMGFAAGSPLLTRGLAQAQPAALNDVTGPINVHEFEEVARKKLNKLAYDFIAGGVEDEHTLAANRAAYSRVFIVPRMMVDTSKVDTSIELLGSKLDTPIIIAPTGGKNLVLPNAENLVGQAAAKSNTLICSGSNIEPVDGSKPPDKWWSNTTGQATKEQALGYAKRVEDRGGKGIVVTVDNPYQSTRDRNNRNRLDYGMMATGVPKPGETFKPVKPAVPGMWEAHTPNMTWEYVGWLRGAVKIPVILKGILHPEDAQLAVQNGANAIIVSNHGGRQLDGAIATLEALPDVVDAVGGKIPVLMDGGIRRGSDILKALALGAKAILIGRAPLWGLGAFGQAGVERVLWMLAIEFKLDMAQAGVPNLAAINRKMARKV